VKEGRDSGVQGQELPLLASPTAIVLFGGPAFCRFLNFFAVGTDGQFLSLSLSIVTSRKGFFFIITQKDLFVATFSSYELMR
jgi:hypothetical protein